MFVVLIVHVNKWYHYNCEEQICSGQNKLQPREFELALSKSNFDQHQSILKCNAYQCEHAYIWLYFCSIACLREEMMIATRDCRLTRMRWDGSINPDMMIHVSAIPFSIDLQHSRGKVHSHWTIARVKPFGQEIVESGRPLSFRICFTIFSYNWSETWLWNVMAT